MSTVPAGMSKNHIWAAGDPPLGGERRTPRSTKLTTTRARAHETKDATAFLRHLALEEKNTQPPGKAGKVVRSVPTEYGSIKSLFLKLDTHRTGAVPTARLRRHFAESGLGWDDATIDTFTGLCDANKSGDVEFMDLFNVCKQIHPGVPVNPTKSPRRAAQNNNSAFVSSVPATPWSPTPPAGGEGESPRSPGRQDTWRDRQRVIAHHELVREDGSNPLAVRKLTCTCSWCVKLSCACSHVLVHSSFFFIIFFSLTSPSALPLSYSAHHTTSPSS